MQNHRMTIRALTGVLMLTAGASAWAGQPTCCASGDNGKPAGTNAIAVSELGKTSPTARNRSLMPDYQVFLFTRDTVRYVEVADAAGTPLAAFSVLRDGLLTLPIGTDVVKQVAVAPAVADVIYENDTMVVGRRRESDGSTTWQVYVK